MSRIMFLNDVLVPYFFIQYFLKAYIPEGVDSKNALISPLFASDDFLLELPRRIILLSGGTDPFLDDAIIFAKRLELLNIPVQHKIYEVLGHGFLNYAPSVPTANKAKNEATGLLWTMFQEIEKEQTAFLAAQKRK